MTDQPLTPLTSTTDHDLPFPSQPRPTNPTLQPGADVPDPVDTPDRATSPIRSDDPTDSRPGETGRDPSLATTLRTWLVAHRGWLPGHSRALVVDVLLAVQAHHDATLVANRTFRVLKRDEASVEWLAAWLANHGKHEAVLLADGDPVNAAIELLTHYLEIPQPMVFRQFDPTTED